MRLVVVSNRLPVALRADPAGGWRVRPGSGGLVTALRPVLQHRRGVWVGWAGTTPEHAPAQRAALAATTRETGYELMPVDLAPEDQEPFYQGYANGAIWPLFHDLPWRVRFDPAAWQAALRVQRRFAEVLVEAAGPDDFVWVHDYHLMGVAQALRELGHTSRTAFFLHIPFPSLDLFVKLPWRFQLLRALLDFDLVGVQTPRDRRNLVQCMRALLPDVELRARGNRVVARVGGREVGIGAFPIGIDFRAFSRHASSPEVVEQAAGIRADEPDRSILLGVDRLDYTKGLPHRLDAFARALERFPELRGAATLVQFVVPSREDVPTYAQFKRDLERQVGEINGRFTRSGWVPVHHVFRALDRTRLLAYYRAAQAALVTPLKDGMNLVAKEYCAANPDGVLVLSEFAGAATQLQHGALLVNPYDVDGTAEAIARAVAMPAGERRLRMSRLRRTIRERDIYWWLEAFLGAAFSRDLDDFPVVDDFVPTTGPEP